MIIVGTPCAMYLQVNVSVNRTGCTPLPLSPSSCVNSTEEKIVEKIVYVNSTVEVPEIIYVNRTEVKIVYVEVPGPERFVYRDKIVEKIVYVNSTVEVPKIIYVNTRFFALIASRPSFASVSTRGMAPVGAAILPVYNALGGPQGKGHVTFDRAQSQYLDAGSRTLNIATNGGLTIVSVVRFTGPVGHWERIIDLGNGPDKDNILVARALSTSDVHVNVRNGASVIIDTTSSSGVLVQNSWLTVVVTYRASTREYWLTVNSVGVSAGIAAAVVTDRMVSLTWMGRSQWGYNPGLGYDASSTAKCPVSSC